MFVAVGVVATLAAIVRGHLLFTARTHAGRLGRERHRTRRTLVSTDLLIALLVFAGGTTIADGRPLAAVLTMAVAAGLVVASLLIEPATSAGAFGDETG